MSDRGPGGRRRRARASGPALRVLHGACLPAEAGAPGAGLRGRQRSCRRVRRRPAGDPRPCASADPGPERSRGWNGAGWTTWPGARRLGRGARGQAGRRGDAPAGEPATGAVLFKIDHALLGGMGLSLPSGKRRRSRPPPTPWACAFRRRPRGPCWNSPPRAHGGRRHRHHRGRRLQEPPIPIRTPCRGEHCARRGPRVGAPALRRARPGARPAQRGRQHVHAPGGGAQGRPDPDQLQRRPRRRGGPGPGCGPPPAGAT